MQLWLRYRTAGRALEADVELAVASQQEWAEAVSDPALISSVLRPTPPLFPLAGAHFVRRHAHERAYRNDLQRNASYGAACRALADRLRRELAGSRCLVYAPLRGALPLWRAVRSFLPEERWDVYYPVTSSFVFFPAASGIRNRKGRPAAGRSNNGLELERLRPLLDAYDHLVYLDEIVSGGAMLAHLDDMIRLRIHDQIPIIVAGVADRFGERSAPKRTQIEQLCAHGRALGFFWEGCAELVTEDQKFLIGVHYVHYDRGLHCVPVLTSGLEDYPEKTQFDRDVLAGPAPHVHEPDDRPF